MMVNGNALCSIANREASGPEVINFFMLNSAEHEYLNAYQYKTIKKLSIFQAQISLQFYFSCP